MPENANGVTIVTSNGTNICACIWAIIMLALLGAVLTTLTMLATALQQIGDVFSDEILPTLDDIHEVLVTS
jgi:hypothetical protein